MEKVTVVWNNHGEGHLVGVFSDVKVLNELKKFVATSKQQKYIKFFEVEMNMVDQVHLLNF
jgi:hypothetical protein